MNILSPSITVLQNLLNMSFCSHAKKYMYKGILHFSWSKISIKSSGFDSHHLNRRLQMLPLLSYVELADKVNCSLWKWFFCNYLQSWFYIELYFPCYMLKVSRQASKDESKEMETVPFKMWTERQTAKQTRKLCKEKLFLESRICRVPEFL